MHLFDAKDTLQKYEKVTDIIDDYYETRLKMYQDRKDYMIEALENELVLLSNKAKYIKENLDGTIDLRKKKKEQIIDMLQQKGYDKIDNDEDYKYLVKMPMDSVTEESVEKLLKDKGNKEVELDNVKKTTINKMWISELDQLKVHYIEYKEERARLMSGEEKKKKVVSKTNTVKKNVKKTNLMIVEDE
jgi:DNA topoisomerase-2